MGLSHRRESHSAGWFSGRGDGSRPDGVALSSLRARTAHHAGGVGRGQWTSSVRGGRWGDSPAGQLLHCRARRPNVTGEAHGRGTACDPAVRRLRYWLGGSLRAPLSERATLRLAGQGAVGEKHLVGGGGAGEGGKRVSGA